MLGGLPVEWWFRLAWHFSFAMTPSTGLYLLPEALWSGNSVISRRAWPKTRALSDLGRNF
jgi:hypothetical protein